MKVVRFGSAFFLVLMFSCSLVFGQKSIRLNNDNQLVDFFDFEFYSNFLITDFALRNSINKAIPDHYGAEDHLTRVQFITTYEEILEKHDDNLNDSLIIQLIKLSATYAYNSLYEAAYKSASLVCRQKTENKNFLLLSNQLAYISSFKTTNYDSAVSHLKELIQLASELNNQEMLVSALMHLSLVYISLNDLSKARLYFSTGHSEAKSTGKHSALVAAIEILMSKSDNKPHPVGFDQNRTDSILYNSSITEAGFYLLQLYQFSLHAEDRKMLLQAIEKHAIENKLNALLIEAGRVGYSISSSNEIVSIQSFQDASWILQQELRSLNSEHQQFYRELISIQTDKQLSSKQKSNRKISGYKAAIFILIIGLLVSVLLLIKIKKMKHDVQEKRTRFNISLKELNSRANNMDSNIDQRVAERNHVMMEELKEREKVDAELKIALKKAEDANYLKNSFLSSMSHEIRTPLNGIMGFSNLLQQEMAELENTELYEYAHSIERSGERLLHLLNNIIDISRIEANDVVMNLNHLKIEDVINQVVDIFSFRANEKGIRIVTDGAVDVPVLADKDILMRVLLEVMDNAVKYTEKGFIKIEYNTDNEKNEQLISIKDTGIGIDESYIPHIFDAFRQESFGYTRQYQGAGLGMPLAQRMMMLMKGSIQVSSAKSVGTVVTIRMPLADKKPVTTIIAEQKINRVPTNTMLRILVVEDDKSSRMIIGRMLKEFGLIELVSDGESAIQTLTKHKESNLFFDVVFLDINLPAPWDGIKLRNHIIKQLPEYESIPFIAQTAYAMAGDQDRFFEAGFKHYIPKPIEKQYLDRIIAELAAKHTS